MAADYSESRAKISLHFMTGSNLELSDASMLTLHQKMYIGVILLAQL